ncbi:hypothetical protein [Promicromonospora aerolata]|uniref:Uncharacterized protein n=1 Tax=Promicromonospora aerolata TaxID=195749 RepID=A0ABW4V3H7_9MICO
MLSAVAEAGLDARDVSVVGDDDIRIARQAPRAAFEHGAAPRVSRWNAAGRAPVGMDVNLTSGNLV